MTIQELILCAKREVALRKNVYPKRVAAGKMTQEKANHEVEAMEAIAVMLERLAPILSLFSETSESKPPTLK